MAKRRSDAGKPRLRKVVPTSELFRDVIDHWEGEGDLDSELLIGCVVSYLIECRCKKKVPSAVDFDAYMKRSVFPASVHVDTYFEENAR